MAMNLGKRIAPPRFLLFVVLFAGGLAAAIPTLGWNRGAMAAFDVAALAFLLAMIPIFRAGEASRMRQASQDNDANRAFLLIVTVVTSIVIMAAVVSEKLNKASSATIALVLASLVLAWLFSNVIYALHYAHLYYLPGDKDDDCKGLEIPSAAEPDYWDFFYFSSCLGMTFQTSDVDITSRRIRRVVTGHCLAAFVFNLGVLAFTINTIGGGG